ncbi:MAG: TlpA family protein disulfide reductase [Phycisphaeraceae bacterium]|nr:TlpA family protein disulfide reductase [Phycisphaeraceae bacterium]
MVHTFIRRAVPSLAAGMLAGAGLLVMGQAQAQPQPAKIVPTQPSKPEKPEVTLKVGDKAPEIQVDSWVKGDAVKAFEPGKVYVVEFWATWCGPCVRAIPHMTETARKHKNDVVVMGIAGSERKPREGDDLRLENLKKFVDEKGDAMDYRVGYDSDREMVNAWLRAAGQDGIPCTFIVGGDGKIAWIGHPMNMDEPLANALKDSKKRGA